MNENLHEPAGYAHLIERHSLVVPRPRHLSFIRLDSGLRRPQVTGFVVDESFPASYRPKSKDDDFDQLVFALKYDGTDLCVLAQLMARVDPGLLAARVKAQPSSKYARRLFFFYEWLTGKRLPLPDLSGVANCPALEADDYFVSAGVASNRHRVFDNLLGVPGFCPIVRRTPRLEEQRRRDLPGRATAIGASVSPALFARAISWLYTKETRSTFAIEHEEPGDRELRFIRQLSNISRARLDDEPELVALQNEIVQPLYREKGFRRAGDLEVYVGQTGRSKTIVHHVGVRSALTADLMTAWSAMRQVEGKGAEVVDAACRSFAFVFIHPFGDGNGRIHRLLLHNRLARRGYFPRDLVVPVSAVLVRHTDHYDQILEDFSRRVMSCTRYELDDEGILTILDAPDDAYRYPDLTPQCEATFEWLERALEEDLVEELDYLRTYDEIRDAVRNVLEMPDRKEQLFIKLCWDNRGRLAKGKRRLFAELDDATIESAWRRPCARHFPRVGQGTESSPESLRVGEDAVMMFSLARGGFAALVLVGVAAPASAAELTAARDPSAIIGGAPVGACGWPSTIWVDHCTATLIHPRVVVLAAHCIVLGGEPVTATFGEDANAPARQVALDGCAPYPGWQPNMPGDGNDDIAICGLAEAVEDVPIVPVMMGCEADVLEPGASTTLVGFGVHDDTFMLGTKYAVDVTVQSVGDEAIFVGDDTASSCNGDSGGPAFARNADGEWRLFGVTSGAASTMPGCPQTAVYTLIHRYMDWIEETAGLDVTPCHDADGTWNPDERCTEFPTMPEAIGGSWMDACDGPRGGASAACGLPFDDGGSSSSGGESESSTGGVIGTETGADTSSETTDTATSSSTSGDESSSSAAIDDAGDGGCACGPTPPTPVGALVGVLVVIATRGRRAQDRRGTPRR